MGWVRPSVGRNHGESSPHPWLLKEGGETARLRTKLWMNQWGWWWKGLAGKGTGPFSVLILSQEGTLLERNPFAGMKVMQSYRWVEDSTGFVFRQMQGNAALCGPLKHSEHWFQPWPQNVCLFSFEQNPRTSHSPSLNATTHQGFCSEGLCDAQAAPGLPVTQDLRLGPGPQVGHVEAHRGERIGIVGSADSQWSCLVIHLHHKHRKTENRSWHNQSFNLN